MPNQFHLGRDVLKGLPHQFLANPAQTAAALRADLFLRVKVMDAVLGVLRLFQLPLLLPAQIPHLLCCARPLEPAVLDPLVQQHKAVSFPQKGFDPVAVPAAEQKQAVGEGYLL